MRRSTALVLKVTVRSINYDCEFCMYQHMQDPIMMTVIAMATSIAPDALMVSIKYSGASVVSAITFSSPIPP